MTSNPITRIAERAGESLYEDEKLRSNMTDAEAEIVLNWASEWLSSQVSAAPDEGTAQQIAQVKGQQVRKVVSALNKLCKNEKMTLAQGASALEPLMTGGKPLARKDILTLLTTLTSAAWDLSSTLDSNT